MDWFARIVTKIILPVACSWARKQERRILAIGSPLTPSQLADATRIGIVHADRVRLRAVDQVPLPAPRSLRVALAKFGAFPVDAVGITLGYGILIRADMADDRRLLAHEFTHVLQYERLGFRPFLKRYLYECLTDSYPRSALEREAREIAEAICAGSSS